MLPALLAALTILSPTDTTKHVFFTGDAGLITTSGNTTVTTIDVAEKLVVVSSVWKFTAAGSVTYARIHDSVTAQLWHGGLRGEREFSKRVSLFLLVEFDRNIFAGISGRETPAFGMSVLAVGTARDTLRADVAGAYTSEEAVAPGVDRHYGGGRLAVNYRRRLGAKSSFEESIEYLPNFQVGADYRLASSTSITAPITTGIAMRAAYVIRYEGIPQPGFVKTDRAFTSGIQVTL